MRESRMEGGVKDSFLRMWLLSWVLKADSEFRVAEGGEKGHPRWRDLGFSLLTCVLPSPGGRDRAGRPLLLVSTTEGAWEALWCTTSEVTKLLSYLCTVPR